MNTNDEEDDTSPYYDEREYDPVKEHDANETRINTMRWAFLKARSKEHDPEPTSDTSV